MLGDRVREQRVIPMLNDQLQEQRVLKQQREEGLVPTVRGCRLIPMSNDRAVKRQRVMLKPGDGRAVRGPRVMPEPEDSRDTRTVPTGPLRRLPKPPSHAFRVTG